MQLINSPIEQHIINSREILIKRDDLLDTHFNGNKARKLAYYLNNDLPDINTIVSYGGIHSNMLVALSYLAKLKNWHFNYYCYKPPLQLANSPQGNYKLALDNDTNFISISNYKLDNFINNLALSPNELLIHQGGRQIESLFGIKLLANEVNNYATINNIKKLTIFIPSGTGTTAFYLQNLLVNHQVITTNCVGSANYLIQQMQLLQTKDFLLMPQIFENTKFRFATPHIELWQTIHKIQQNTNIEFDLVYDPIGWYILLNSIDKIYTPILYLHCGGTSANISMQQRYRYKYLSHRLD